MSKKTSKSHYSTQSKPTSAPSAAQTPANTSNVWQWLALGAILATVGMIRLRLLGIPFERDEGEYAYIGKLILEGIPPYKEAYNMKLPGTYYMYALLMTLFGTSIQGVHFGLLCINLGTILLLFFGIKRLYNIHVGLITGGIFGIMSISANLLGFAAHATHFVSLYIALGIFFLSIFCTKPHGYWALLTGISFGLSFVMKQQAVFMMVFGFLAISIHYVFQKPLKISSWVLSTCLYTLGALIPYGIVVLTMIGNGVFEKFWFWTVSYASKYASSDLSFSDVKMLFRMSFEPMYKEFTAFWWISGIGLLITYFSAYDIKHKILATLIFVFTFFTVIPGFYFRQHYFIPFLIGIGLSAGIALDSLGYWLVHKLKVKNLVVIPFLLFVFISIGALAASKEYYFKMKTDQLCKRIYGTNPFIESVEIARFIKENSQKSDKIAVLGSEPQLFFYADRHSATGYIYTYNMMEIHEFNLKMQQEMIAEIEKNNPKYLIYCNVRTSWLPRPESPMDIFKWFENYSRQNYDLVGLADGLNSFQPLYVWNEQAQTYQLQGQEYVMIFKRKAL